MPSAIVSSILSLFTSFIPGSRLVDGGDLQTLAKLLFSTADGLTAHAGGGQANALPLTAALNNVTTVASGNDSVALPLAIPGQFVVLSNNAAANSMQVYGNPTNPNNPSPTTGAPQSDVIIAHNSSSAAAAGTGVAHAASTMGIYACTKLGVWKQMLSS